MILSKLSIFDNNFGKQYTRRYSPNFAMKLSPKFNNCDEKTAQFIIDLSNNTMYLVTQNALTVNGSEFWRQNMQSFILWIKADSLFVSSIWTVS